MDFLLFLISILILARGASWFASSSVKLSLLFKVPQAVVGATIVSLATTAPETIVASFSTISGHQGLALGNVLGSPVVNLSFAFALLLLFSEVFYDRRLIREVAILLIALLFLYLLLIFYRETNFVIGALLLLFALIFLFGQFLAFRRGIDAYISEVFEAQDIFSLGKKLKDFFGSFFMLVLGFLLVLLGGSLLVSTGSNLAKMLSVPEIFIGLTFFAIGTSLPEIALTMVTIWNKKVRISAGNLFGASILTLTWALGIASLFGKISVPSQVLYFDLPALILIILIILGGHFLKISKKIVGGSLLVFYLFYLIFLKFI